MTPSALLTANEAMNGSQEVLTSAQHPLCHIITPIGMLGYSFDHSLTYNALLELSKNLPNIPTALILDSGSTDSGPAKLALGSMTCPRSAYERDLRSLMSLSHEFGASILIGSAGGDGTDAHVDEFLDIIQEITDEPGNEYETLISPFYLQWLIFMQVIPLQNTCNLQQRLQNNSPQIPTCGQNHRLWSFSSQADGR